MHEGPGAGVVMWLPEPWGLSQSTGLKVFLLLLPQAPEGPSGTLARRQTLQDCPLTKEKMSQQGRI